MSDSIPVINGQLVRTRRLEVGLSERALASIAGISLATLTDIEDHDGRDRHIKLIGLFRLAEALDLTPMQLVDVPPADAPTPEPGRGDAQDDADAVGHLLFEARVVLNIDDVAQALGWTYQRTRQALQCLDGRLKGTGFHVHLFTGRAQLRPCDPAAGLTATVSTVLSARRGIDRPKAALLYRTLTGSGKSGRGIHGTSRGRSALLSWDWSRRPVAARWTWETTSNTPWTCDRTTALPEHAPGALWCHVRNICCRSRAHLLSSAGTSAVVSGRFSLSLDTQLHPLVLPHPSHT